VERVTARRVWLCEGPYIHEGSGAASSIESYPMSAIEWTPDSPDHPQRVAMARSARLHALERALTAKALDGWPEERLAQIEQWIGEGA
jgi:hypothetical protein